MATAIVIGGKSKASYASIEPTMRFTHRMYAGGVGGLAAAAAALKHFDKVTIIEKDDLVGGRISMESVIEVGCALAPRAVPWRVDQCLTTQ